MVSGWPVIESVEVLAFVDVVAVEAGDLALMHHDSLPVNSSRP